MNRRTLLKAGIVVAATSHTAALAPALAADDSHLIALGEQLKVAWAEEKRCDPLGRDPDAFERAYAISDRLVDAIEAVPAQTLAGLQVKALAVAWCYGSDKIELDGDTTDVRISSSIIRDLLSYSAAA